MANETKSRNPYHLLIEEVCELYASGDFARAEDKSTLWLMSKEEQQNVVRSERIGYLKNKFSGKKKFQPLWQAADAFSSHEQYNSLGLMSGLCAKDVSDKMEPLLPYLNGDCFRRLNPEVLELLPRQKKQSEAERRFENSQAGKTLRNLRVIEKVIEKKDFEPQFEDMLILRRKQLAFELYSELHREYTNPALTNEERCRNLDLMIGTVSKIPWSRQQQFKIKSQLYGVLSKLHLQNGQYEEAKKAKDEELRFEKAIETTAYHSIKRQAIKEWER